MTTKEIIIQYLRAIGADGLIHPECPGCSIAEIERYGGCDTLNCIPAKKATKDCGPCERIKNCLQIKQKDKTYCFIQLEPLPEVEIVRKK